MELNLKKTNFKNIHFDEPQELRSNFVSKAKDKYYFTFIKQICQRGLKKITKRSGKYLDINLTNNDYLKFIYDLDNYMIKYVSENSEKWFGIFMDENKVSDFFISSLLENENDEYFIRAKLPMRGNRSTILIKDSKDNKIDTHRFPDENLLISGSYLLKGLKFLKDELIAEFEIVEIVLHNPLPKLNLTNILSDHRGRESVTTSQVDSDDSSYEDKLKDDNFIENRYNMKAFNNIHDESKKDNHLESHDNNDVNDLNKCENEKLNNAEQDNDLPNESINEIPNKLINKNENECETDNKLDDHDKYDLKINMHLSNETKDDISQIIREKKNLLNEKKKKNENDFQNAEELSIKIDELKKNAVKSAREIRILETDLGQYTK